VDNDNPKRGTSVTAKLKRNYLKIYNMRLAFLVIGVILCLWGTFIIYAAFSYMSMPAGFLSGAGNTIENTELLVTGLAITLIGTASLILGKWLGKAPKRVTKYSQ